MEDMTSVGQVPQEKPRKKSGKWILVVIAVLLVGIGGGLFALGAKKNNEVETSPTPTPLIEGLSAPDTTGGTEEPEASPEAEAEVDKADVAVEILNGTGTSGEAGYLQGIVKGLGYSDIEVGNASSQDFTATEVTFSSDLPEDLVSEMTKKLESIYKEVTTKTSKSLTLSIKITTGERAGAATKSPAASPTPTASPTVTE